METCTISLHQKMIFHWKNRKINRPVEINDIDMREHELIYRKNCIGIHFQRNKLPMSFKTTRFNLLELQTQHY